MAVYRDRDSDVRRYTTEVSRPRWKRVGAFTDDRPADPTLFSLTWPLDVVS